MKNIDFLFVYEHKARELENICLLRAELEKRGYTVEFLNSWYCINHKPVRYNARVLVVSACYDGGTLGFFSSFAGKFRQVANLQWEQIMTNAKAFDKNAVWCIRGLARAATHISWGDWNKNRLIDFCGVPKENVKVTGHIGLDFLRKEFDGYYLTKEKLFKQYNLTKYKKVCLFISSFSFVNLPEKEMQTASSAIDVDVQHKLCVDSQKGVLDWIKTYLSKNPEVAFVYRRHPAEANNVKLAEIAGQFDNFFEISELSVKQWILTCDVIYTWWSTSVGEIYAAGKACSILRPTPIQKEFDLPIYDGAKFVENYADFEKSVDETGVFPIDETQMQSFYHIEKDMPTYKKIADVLCELYLKKEKNMALTKGKIEKETHPDYNLGQKLRRLVSKCGYGALIGFLAHHTAWTFAPIQAKRKYDNEISNDEYTNELQQKNMASKEELDVLLAKFKKIV